ncbi:hypothetical protein I2485_06880 [Nesterenkonia sp. E16_7]|uniref:hypothetical protein n=1 Tax=unclassified Nesterenkonia TaxID=2629769 RepID=UPI001A934070|nr:MULTISPECIES: hypothetical protein [unclassified Nesterenkonia]MBO0596599.1 hypothetical protein [Nesterenkonia sp. E16_10]MBO0598376.1 hypothetical protein [Nesterenkonia sp. E16_7]
MDNQTLTAVLGVGAAVLAGLVAMIGHLYSRLHKLEERNLRLDRRMTEMWEGRRADAVVIRKQAGHIDLLEFHIWNKLGPPPPDRPDGV